MPSSLRSTIKKYSFQGKLTKEETDGLLQKLDNHDKELLKEFAEKLIENQPCDNFKDEMIYYISENDIKTALKEYGIGK